MISSRRISYGDCRSRSGDDPPSVKVDHDQRAQPSRRARAQPGEHGFAQLRVVLHSANVAVEGLAANQDLRALDQVGVVDLRREGDQNGELRSFFPGFPLLGWLSFFCFGGCLGGDFPLGSFLSALFFFVCLFLDEFEIKIDRKGKHRLILLESSSDYYTCGQRRLCATDLTKCTKFCRLPLEYVLGCGARRSVRPKPAGRGALLIRPNHAKGRIHTDRFGSAKIERN